MAVSTKILTCVALGMMIIWICMLSDYNIFAQTSNLKQYVNDTYGIEVQYPMDWTVDNVNYFEDQGRFTTLVTFASEFDSPKDVWRDSVAIVYDDIPYKAELDEYLNEALDAYKDYKNFRLISSGSGDTMLAGYPAYKLTYTYEDENYDSIELRVTEIGSVVAGKGYYFEFVSQENSFKDYEDIFNKMTDSFRLRGVEGTPETTLQNDIENVNDTQFNTYSGTNLTGNDFQGISSAAGPGLKSYENSYFGIRKLEYPEEWSVYENATSIQFISPAKDATPPSVSVTTYLSENRPLEDFVADDIRYFDSNPYSYQIIESKPIKLNGNQPAHMEVFAYFDNQSNVYKAISVLTIRNDTLYYISYFAPETQYQKYLPAVINLIRSLDLGTDSEVQNNEAITEPPAILSPL